MLENPIEEIIAGYITDVVKEYFNVFICIIDFFNLLHGVNKNRRKLFEEIIDDEVGRVQITVVKSPWVEIANTPGLNRSKLSPHQCLEHSEDGQFSCKFIMGFSSW